jgi:hypothetical protein
MLAPMNRLLLSALLLCPLLVSLPVASQQTSTVTLHVTDQTNAEIPNAEVRIAPQPSQTPATRRTDAMGEVSATLGPGSYLAFVSSQGFRTTTRCIDVSTKDLSIPITLQVAASGGPIVVQDVHSLALWDSRRGEVHPPVSISPADLSALPHTTVTLHNAHTHANETYSGVPLADLLAKLDAPLGKELHGKALASYIMATGIDGYSAVLALAEADPTFHSGQVLVADHLAGKPLGKDGPFKLIVTEDKRPARWVRNLDSIELRTP